MAAAGLAAAAAIWFTTGWLLDTTGRVMDRDPKATGADRARVRVEAVRTGLAAGAGAGAAVGLMLAFRRQAHTEHDTTERHVTELYNAAAEQLGSDKAPVRLTALYTLERLANDNRRHRQTIVNIICAYLRMPFTPPSDQPGGGDTQRQAARRYQAARTGRSTLQPPPAEPDPHEELQVRLTAQRILQTHLQPTSDVPWTGITLDLTGVTLTGLTLANCTVTDATFGGATFASDADFRGASFSGRATFGGASFSGRADFGGATFSDFAYFRRATFPGFAGFRRATFSERADFRGASFSDHATFDRATFSDHAHFDRATFSGIADFGEAEFQSVVVFEAAVVTDRNRGHAPPAGGGSNRLRMVRASLCRTRIRPRPAAPEADVHAP